MKKQSGDKYGLLAGAGLLAVLAIVFLPRTGDEPRPAGAPGPAATAPRAAHPVTPLVGRPAADSPIHSVLTPSSPAAYVQLLQRIDALPDTLTEAEAHAICRALREDLPDYPQLPAGQKHHLANQLMDAVLRQKSPGVWLAEGLAQIWQSKKADETLRDYALQHLAQLMEGRGPASLHLSSWRSTGLPVLVAAARDVDQRSAGTALLALHFLSSPPAVSGSTGLQVPELDDLIDSVAGNEKAHPAARAAAFQTGAARNRSNSLAAARRLAGDPSVNSGLRLSAIHYLGACGDGAADRDLLTAVERENDVRYLTASQSARTRLLSRIP